MNDMSFIETPIGILEIHTIKDFLCNVQFMSETTQNRKIISRNENPNVLLDIRHEDIINYGFIPELVGRLQVLSPLEILTKKSMKLILIKPKNSIIKQYQHLFSLDNVKLIFTDNAINIIVIWQF